MAPRRPPGLPVEWLDDDDGAADAPTRRRGSSIGAVLVAFAVLAVAGLALVVYRPGGDAKPAPVPEPATPRPTRSPAASTPRTVPGALTIPSGRVTAMLPSPLRLDLLVTTSRSLLRADLAAGSVSSTPLPPIDSTGPVFLLPVPGAAVVRPLDNVDGYLMPDNAPPEPLRARLSTGTLGAFPGPNPGQIWLFEGTVDEGELLLVDAAGTVSLNLPFADVYPAGPDGNGGVVLAGQSTPASMLADATGVEPITNAHLLAAGSSAWFVQDCAPECVKAVVDRVSGGRRVVGAIGPAIRTSCLGAVSPDAASAALCIDDPAGSQLEVFDLATGELLQSVTMSRLTHNLAWSPDSRYLFFVDEANVLQAFDRVTGAIASSFAVPDTTNFALRPATAAPQPSP
jgi:hypothetical protein